MTFWGGMTPHAPVPLRVELSFSVSPGQLALPIESLWRGTATGGSRGRLAGETREAHGHHGDGARE